MANLTFTLRANMAAVHDDASPEHLRSITARVAADLRAAADQIENGGLSGYWENVIPAGNDADGYPRVKYALKCNVPHNKSDLIGPACPPALPELRAGQLMRELDALMHAVQCVFPDDVINAANEIIQETGAWSHANVGQAYATARNRDILREYMTAYQCSDEQARRVYARALANNMRKVTK